LKSAGIGGQQSAQDIKDSADESQRILSFSEDFSLFGLNEAKAHVVEPSENSKSYRFDAIQRD
jgi:hypothetical protein